MRLDRLLLRQSTLRCTFGALVLYGLFISSQWTSLSILVSKQVEFGLTALGHRVNRTCSINQWGIVVDGQAFSITRDCTYLELFVWLAPFVWRRNSKLTMNLAVILLLLVMVSAVNFLRLMFTFCVYSRGASWFAAHDLPDLLIFYPTIAIAVLLSVRRDSRVAPA